jgi:hypothetical protein
MKNWLKIVSIIGLTVITQTAYSAAVTDDFETGDTLTAAKLNNIKDAVNDNNTRIGAAVFSTAPTVTDDMNSPYTVGTVWIDTSDSTVYILVDSSSGAAVWSALGGSGSLYAIGDAGPAGGIVFYVTDGGLHGLEAAAVDQGLYPWGCEGYPITGASGSDLGTGEQNTADIIAGCDDTTAALVASAYGPGWYLPSVDELMELHDTYWYYGAGSFGIDGISDVADYWSSTVATDTFSVAGDLGTSGHGAAGGHPASMELRVRAVKSF